jgi:hypothetical protein
MNNNWIRITLSLSPDVRDEFKKKCKKNGKTMSEVAESLMEAYSTGKLNIVTENRIEVVGE